MYFKWKADYTLICNKNVYTYTCTYIETCKNKYAHWYTYRCMCVSWGKSGKDVQLLSAVVL